MLTPMVSLPRFCPTGKLYAKLEMHCPTGSSKYRPAKAILENALRTGVLAPGGTVMEATSGNMGIALAALCAKMGLRCIIVMPESMSMERRKLMEAYDAQVVLVSGTMADAVRQCHALAATIPGSFLPRQFENPDNPMAHFHTTGPEIFAQCPEIHSFVAGVGTGGTLTGVGHYLKAQNPHIQLVAVEPTTPGEIAGIGAGFLPSNLDMSILDMVMAVSLPQALQTRDALARTEGIFAGPSSGAALYAAQQLARQPDNRDKHIVVLLPDSGERYLSQ